MDRSAIDTIKGYFYQFDYSILSLLSLNEPNDSVEIECIEDIDINTATETTAVQCKYYAKTEYNHSVIKEPIMYMLSHFKEIKSGSKKKINYLIRGYYESGQNKITLPIDVAFLKNNFLTYTKTESIGGVKSKVTYRHHDDLGLSDTDLAEFLNYLKIDINAQEFFVQLKSIIDKLKLEFTCSDFSADYFYYNNALRVVKDISIQPLAKDRVITKQNFLNKLNTKNILFNEWFIQIRGLKSHLAALKSAYFSFLNISPFERFFLIEADYSAHSQNDLVGVINIISRKWSKLGKREPNPFCPYVYINGISGDELVKVKKQLLSEGLILSDGHSFLGADFNVEAIIKQANFTNGIRLKMLSETDEILIVLNTASKRKEIYQFYLTKPFFETTFERVNHIKIQVSKISDISQII